MLKTLAVQMLMRGVMAPVSANTRMRYFLSVAASILVCVAVGFLVTAAHYWFLSEFTPQEATLMTAGVVLAIACLCFIGAWVIGARQRSHLRNMQKDMQKNLNSVLELLDDGVGQNVREHPVISLLIASMAGYALTDIAT